MKKMFSTISKVVTALILCNSCTAHGQQEVDNDFVPAIDKPLFENGKGPVLLIDGGHHNFHTLEDKFAPFGKAAAMDGFRVKSNNNKLNSVDLNGVKILVIANALNEKNTDEWKQPVYPAFTSEEIKQISQWVQDGGRLFLIADHMPFPGAIAALAKEFGYTMNDGFALLGPKTKFDLFTYGNGMLQHTQLTDMHGGLDSIVSFTGQAFGIPDSATSVITFNAGYKILLPEEAWKFSHDTKMVSAMGLSQLAYSNYGKGKIVMAGEAAMFTAQKVGDQVKFGINSELAPNNLQLLLNILEWLNK